MPIPLSQLDTWSNIGSQAQSTDTYNIIKNCLESASAPYATKSFNVYLQGSYGNSTNIWSESDVDIVIELRSAIYANLDNLTDAEKRAYQQSTVSATYTHADFKKSVMAHLVSQYGSTTTSGEKAIKIPAGGSRRNADVVVAAHHRWFTRYVSASDFDAHEGICLFTLDGTKVVNYPKMHRANCITKNQATSERFKPMVRIFKNMRTRLVEKGMIADKSAQSYYLEGLLYNVPDEKFSSSRTDAFVNCLNWLLATDRSQLVCANERYYLLRTDPHVTWEDAKCTAFLNAAADLWTNWGK